MTKLYQPHYDNGEAWSDHHDWSSKNVYLTEAEAIAEIKSKGYTQKGRKRYAGEQTYVPSTYSDDLDYGFYDVGYAYVDVLTLGGDTDGVEILRKAGK